VTGSPDNELIKQAYGHAVHSVSQAEAGRAFYIGVVESSRHRLKQDEERLATADEHKKACQLVQLAMEHQYPWLKDVEVEVHSGGL
jgi:hypothetical protein